MPAPTSAAAVPVASSPLVDADRRDGDDDRQSGRAEERRRDPITPCRARAVRRAATAGRARRAAARRTTARIARVRGRRSRAARSNVDARVDEEHRNEEPVADGLELALDDLGVGLRALRRAAAGDHAGGERAEQHVEVEHDAERDERDEHEDHQAHARTARCVCRVAVIDAVHPLGRRPERPTRWPRPATRANSSSTIAATERRAPARGRSRSRAAARTRRPRRARSPPTPNGVRRSPESRSTGMIVPSAVEVSAIADEGRRGGVGGEQRRRCRTPPRGR